MDDLNGGSGFNQAPETEDLNRFGDSSTGNAVFDASQYAFFGNDVVEEVELGGLEDEEEELPVNGTVAEEIMLYKEEADDLASTLSKLNRDTDGFSNIEQIPEKRSRQNSVADEWAQPIASRNLIEQRNMYRTTSYPEPQHQHQLFSSESVLVPESSHASYPHPGSRSPDQRFGHLASSQPQLAGMHNGSLQFRPVSNRQSARWMNQQNMFLGDALNQQQFARQSGSMSPHMMPPMQGPQNRLTHPMQSPHGQFFNSNLSQTPSMGKYDAALGCIDLRDGRPGSTQGNRQNLRFHQQGFEHNSGWPPYRSEYMGSDEIENILRMKLAATHSNDPYVDDYYYQARLAKKSADAKLKHRFCPTHLRDLTPHARSNNETHSFLQVDALGRVPFSSIRRPRPLLEVGPSNSSNSSNAEQRDSDKPLEQEPMVVARVRIENGFCVLLDVEDIDRYLEFNQFQDGGISLRQRRQAQLEGLAASLHLIDPLVKSERNRGLSVQDNLLFLRIISLPKGRKFLVRYIQLLYQGSELMRIICMAIFRHLRSLFGVFASDHETTEKLAEIVVLCIQSMDLGQVSACLAAVSCSSAQPPLHPLGSSSRDGASIVLKSTLDRAAELIRTNNYNSTSMALWRASFNEFFSLLMKYCVSKYDIIMQYACEMTEAAGQTIVRETPTDLLRASFPHINERQKSILVDFLKCSSSGKP